MTVSNGQAKVNKLDGESIAMNRECNEKMLPSADGIGMPNCANEVMTVQKALVWAQDDEGLSRSHRDLRIIDPKRR